MIFRYALSNGKFSETEESTDSTWIRLAKPTENELEQISKETGIEIDDLKENQSRDKGSMFKSEPEYTMTLLDVPYINSNGRSFYNTRSIMIICTKRGVVTVSQKRNDVVDDFINNPPKNLSSDNLTGLQFQLILSIMNRYCKYINKINQMRRDIEKNLNVNVNDVDIYNLHQMESSLIYFITSVKSFLPILDKMQKFYGELTNDNADLFEDMRIRATQAFDLSTIYKEVIMGTRDLFNTMVSNKLNAVMKTLTVITLVLSVPLLVAGIYGMNVDLPMDTHQYGFIFVCALMIVFTAMALLTLRKKRII